MEKHFETALLLDIYAPLLTEKQRRLCDMYYNQDYSLAEIAHIENTTRQAARDGIAKAGQKLMCLEKDLGVCEKRRKTLEAVDRARLGEYTAKRLLCIITDIWE
ncbi:MAG: hypothetical protein WDA65_01985 [Christensenellales bacterium]